jgi:hypothetical protein
VEGVTSELGKSEHIVTEEAKTDGAYFPHHYYLSVLEVENDIGNGDDSKVKVERGSDIVK